MDPIAVDSLTSLPKVELHGHIEGSITEVSTTINRAIEEVFATLSDLSNNTKWASGSLETPTRSTS